MFTRTWPVRLIPAVTAAGAGWLLLADAAAGRLEASWWTAAVALVGAVTLVAAVLAWTDRVTVDDAGLHAHNLLLRRLGRRPRTLPWESLRAVRRFHGPPRPGPGSGRGPPALFEIRDDGGRWVLDTLQGMERLEELLEARLAAASGASAPPVL